MSLRLEVARAIGKKGAWCGLCNFEEDNCRECERLWLVYADAALETVKRFIYGEEIR